MICNRCGFDNADGKVCKSCGSILSVDDGSKGAHFIIGKNHDEQAVKSKKDISSFDGSVAAASNDFYKNKKGKKKVNKGKLAVWITSIILIILIILSCGYILIDSLNRNKIPTVTKEDADAILTAFEGPALARIKDKFRSADSDSGREAARKEALNYFNSLEDMETIESVELSQDGSKIYFKCSYTECVFVMDDPTPDTYNASTVLSDEISQIIDGTFSADRDLTNFKHGIENNILIISATENHRSIYDKLDSMLYYFEDATLNVNYIKTATLHNFTKDLGNYNAIFIHAQSFIDRNGKTVLALNEKATSANIVGYSYQLANGQSSVYGSMMTDNAGFTVTDTLIKESYEKAMPDSLVYMSADSGYGPGNSVFAKAFGEAGARIFVGYSNKVSAAYEAACVKDLAEYIITGKTIDDAYQYVITKNGESDGDETPAYFGYYGVSDWSLYGWELHSGTESLQITGEDELFDSLNYAMLSLGTNSISQKIEGYRVIDADNDGAKELFMMAKMDGELTTNLAFDTFTNAQIALDTSKSEDYDFRTLYDSANTQIYLCEQFTNDNSAKTLYTWTNMGWETFARYSDEKAGTPTFIWDGKNISEAAFNANFQKVSQGALLSNWRSMLNLYYQTADRNKTVTDLTTKFKTMSGVCESLATDFDGDGSNEAAIVISGFGNEWLKNIAIMSRTGKEQILYTQNFGTFIVYIDETDVGVVFRVAYLGADAKEELTLSVGETGGVDIYYPDIMKTVNIKFNGEVTDTTGFTIVEKYDDSVYSLEGVWEISGIDNAKITFSAKNEGTVYAENYSFATTDFKEGVFKHSFIATNNTIEILLDGGYRTFTLQWHESGEFIAITDHVTKLQRVLTKIDKYDPDKVPSIPDSSSSESESSNTSSESTSSEESSQ